MKLKELTTDELLELAEQLMVRKSRTEKALQGTVRELRTREYAYEQLSRETLSIGA